jgi:hypothetical protein
VTGADELNATILRIDREIARIAPGTDLQRDWASARGELRLRRRQSERSLPAVATAAQLAAQLVSLAPSPEIRDAAKQLLDALASVPATPLEDSQ